MPDKIRIQLMGHFSIYINEVKTDVSNKWNEIKSDMRNMRNDIQDLRDRLIIVEQSTKSAHHRLDGLEGKKETSQ